MLTHTLAPAILRAYDIRGLWQQNLCEKDAWAIGLALGNSLGNSLSNSLGDEHATTAEALVARDGRSSSLPLSVAMLQGLSESGLQAWDLGCLPTPALYFAEAQARSEGRAARLAVMITGSHNPPQHNGFKILRDGRPLHQEDLQALATQTRNLKPAARTGAIRRCEHVLAAYTSRLGEEAERKEERMIGRKEERSIKAVWDVGGGAAAVVLPALLERMQGEHFPLFAKLDSHFSARSPDPSKLGALDPLSEEVARRNADIGLAFDGDGDRLVVVLADGRTLSGDSLLLLFAHELMQHEHASAPIVLADVKTSPTILNAIAALGAQPQLVATGHSNIKHALRERKALLAGEVSGHFFFADRYFGFDDALYAAVRLCVALSRGLLAPEKILATLPPRVASRELRIPIDNRDKFAFVEKACRALQGSGALQDSSGALKDSGTHLDTLDGARIVHADGSWWLLRASNTEEALVLFAEAPTARRYRQLCAAIGAFLSAQGLAEQDWQSLLSPRD